MKTINDPRLPFTTSLPNGVSLEAVVKNKATLLAGGSVADDQQAELFAVQGQKALAKTMGDAELPYSDDPENPRSSWYGCPPDAAPATPPENEASAGTQANQASPAPSDKPGQ